MVFGKERKEVKMKSATEKSLLEGLFEPVCETPQSEIGEYNPNTQTWSHRNARLMSPVKHNQEA